MGMFGSFKVKKLMKDLASDKDNVRENAAKALEKRGWQPKDDLERAYYLIAKEKWDELVKIGEPAIEPLIKALKDKSSPLSVITVLGEMGDVRAVEPLIQSLKDTIDVVRGEAAEALGKIGDKKAVGPLIQVLKDEAKWVRMEAAEALGTIEDERAVEPLIPALKDEEELVRGKAAEALRNIGWQPKDDFEKVYYLLAQLERDKLAKIGEPAVEPLIKALKDHEDYVVRECAAEALGEVGDVRAVEPLIQALKDAKYIVRWTAAEALGEVGDARAVEPLIQVVKKDDARDARSKAAEALGKIGDKRAVEPLIQALKDKDEVVREYVAESLGKIGD